MYVSFKLKHLSPKSVRKSVCNRVRNLSTPYTATVYSNAHYLSTCYQQTQNVRKLI